MGAEPGADGLGRRLALGAVAIGQQVQHLVDRHLLALERQAHGGDALVEEPVPGRAPDHRFVMQQPLGLVGELMRAEAAHRLEPGPVARERGGLQLLLQRLVVDAIDLEGEEDGFGGDVGDALLDRLVEAAVLRIAHIAGIDELGVAADLSQDILQRLIGLDRLGQLLAVEAGELALEALGQFLGFRRRPGEVAVDAGRLGALIEVAQVPLRKRTEIRAGGVVHERFPVLGWQDDFGQSMRLARI